MILLYIVQAKAPGKLRVTCTKENKRCCESVIYTSARFTAWYSVPLQTPL